MEQLVLRVNNAVCSCVWAGDGDQDNGSLGLYIADPDEKCVFHGREAMPASWAAADAMKQDMMADEAHREECGCSLDWRTCAEDKARRELEVL